MRTIHPPPRNLSDKDRLTACRSALEPALWQVIDRAKYAGWSGAEAALASSLVMASFAEGEMAEVLAPLVREAG